MTSSPLPAAVKAPCATRPPREELVRGAPRADEPLGSLSCAARKSPRHPNLLRARLAAPPLNRGDDFNAIQRVGHRHGRMPHTLLSGRPCQVTNTGAISIMSSPACASAPPSRSTTADSLYCARGRAEKPRVSWSLCKNDCRVVTVKLHPTIGFKHKGDRLAWLQ